MADVKKIAKLIIEGEVLSMGSRLSPYTYTVTQHKDGNKSEHSSRTVMLPNNSASEAFKSAVHRHVTATSNLIKTNIHPDHEHVISHEHTSSTHATEWYDKDGEEGSTEYRHKFTKD